MSNKGKAILSTRTLVGASLLTAISIILTRVFAVMVPLGGLPALRLSFGEIPLIITGILFGPIAGGLSGAVADLIGVTINTTGGFFPGFTISSILWGAIPGLFYLVIKKTKVRINYNIVNSVVIIILAVALGNLLFTNGIISLQNGKLSLSISPLYGVLLVLFILIVLAFIIVPAFATRKYKGEESLYSIDKIIFTVTVPYIIISMGLNTLWLSIMFQKGFMLFLPGRIVAGLVMIPLHSMIIFILSRFFKYVKN